MNFEEFLNEKKGDETESLQKEAINGVEESTDTEVELDVQRAVVESLAADKAVQDERIATLETDKNVMEKKCSELEMEVGRLSQEIIGLKNEALIMKAKLDEQSVALANVGDLLARNSEKDVSNQLSLLDHPEEFKDRFAGEIRDHVLEVIREGRDQAEKEGRFRRAQVLESVLVANEPCGSLQQKREELEKLFRENANIVSGTVIEELSRQGISHRNGEDYLLPSEIIKRNF